MVPTTHKDCGDDLPPIGFSTCIQVATLEWDENGKGEESTAFSILVGDELMVGIVSRWFVNRMHEAPRTGTLRVIRTATFSSADDGTESVVYSVRQLIERFLVSATGFWYWGPNAGFDDKEDEIFEKLRIEIPEYDAEPPYVAET